MNSQTKLLAISICILSVAVLNQFCSAAPTPSEPSTGPNLNGPSVDVTTISSETPVTSGETTTKEETTAESTTEQPLIVTNSSTISEIPKSLNPKPIKPLIPALKVDTPAPTPTEAKKSTTTAPEVAEDKQALDKKDEVSVKTTITPLMTSELTTTKPPPTTQLSTTTTVSTTTVTPTKATTQQPSPTTTKKKTQTPVVKQTTHLSVTTLPPPVVLKTQPPPATAARTTLSPSTQKPQPVKTEGPHQGDHDESGDHHTHSPLTSNPGTNKNDTDNSWLDTFSHNSLISKLMFPVILGVVAAFVIVCFAYGVRAYRKNKSRGRRKMMSNGQDHDMSTNFDRVKLLADSSEDEF